MRETRKLSDLKGKERESARQIGVNKKRKKKYLQSAIELFVN